jgi:hypothetical protein
MTLWALLSRQLEGMCRKDQISGEHIGRVLESLRYYKINIQNYQG